jgi:hypothetical protein
MKARAHWFDEVPAEAPAEGKILAPAAGSQH